MGSCWEELGRRVLVLVWNQVSKDQSRVVVAIDGSPTKRYGPQVQGASIHHDPTPGPTGHPFCYGHIWVTLAVIALPIWSWRYVRQKDVSKIPAKHGWRFQTKLEQAFDLVLMTAETLLSLGKELWGVTDGAYAKKPFVRPALEVGATLVGRLRKDSSQWDLPPKEKTRRRGRKRKYGKNRISLSRRAANRHGWIDVACTVYGRQVVKRVKTFLATHRTFGGAIRVVIVQEKTGPQFFYCTAVNASVREIVEIFSDRASIEQVFHDVKEIWGSGQQQVRHLWPNIGAWHLNLWLHTLVEVWAWNKSAKELAHREDLPWDNADRRPSHADRRKALQTACLLAELSEGLVARTIPRKFRDTIKRLLRVAV